MFYAYQFDGGPISIKVKFDDDQYNARRDIYFKRFRFLMDNNKNFTH